MQTMASKMSSTFMGPEVRTGNVTLSMDGSTQVLTLSNDVTIPDAPDPHWQVVDGMGNAYLLQRLKVAGDRVNRSIALPSYAKGITAVRIYCAFADVVLGEARFDARM